MNVEGAFLRAIRECPDDDVPRLVYADWLTDHGDTLGQAHGELIRVQCALARGAEDDPRLGALAEREKALLDAHSLDWTDLAFAAWLGHRKRGCRNPQGHEFCKIVRQGILTRCERDRAPEDGPLRQRLSAKFAALRQRMEDETGYLPDTADMSLLEDAEFRRGFVERATVQDWAIDLFAEALPELGVLRELVIENDSGEDALGGTALERLVSVLGRVPLAFLDSHSEINAFEPVRSLANARAARRLTRLHLWFSEHFSSDYDDGDEYVFILADSRNLTGLRDIELEHSRRFTDAAFLAVLDSPHLAGLTSCRLRPNETMPLSAAVIRRFSARFGPQIEEDAVVRE